jgi:transcriptional regulator with XRE-family HTH domain
MTTETLYQAACRLIKACPRHISFAQIAKGTGLTTSWISAFSRNEIPDPGIHKVQKLFDYLSVERPPVEGRYPFSEAVAHAREKHSCVYIIYAGEQVIYVGCSLHPKNRIQFHSKLNEFRLEGASHIEFVYFDEETDWHKLKAQAYEDALIKQHLPKLNLRGKPVNKAMQLV